MVYFLRTIKRSKAKWIGHILRRNCLLSTLLEEIDKGRYDDEEDVNSY
jgi:hypothetical protein